MKKTTKTTKTTGSRRATVVFALTGMAVVAVIFIAIGIKLMELLDIQWLYVREGRFNLSQLDQVMIIFIAFGGGMWGFFYLLYRKGYLFIQPGAERW